MKTVAIMQAEYLGKHEIRFTFSDKSERTIDFSGFLSRSRNPMTRKFLDKKLFKVFKIEFGDIVWNDYELCFPIQDLYEGAVQLNTETSVAVSENVSPIDHPKPM